MLKMKGMRFPKEIILVCIRWYAAYALSYRNLEEMMQERGVSVDHSTINRWAIRYLPLLEKIFRRHKRPVGGSWRMDETYIKVRGQWKYLYRAVDKEGKTIDFLLRAKRDKAAATKFFNKAMRLNGDPAKVTMDKSGANKAAMDGINQDRAVSIEIRQIKYLNNIVEGSVALTKSRRIFLRIIEVAVALDAITLPVHKIDRRKTVHRFPQWSSDLYGSCASVQCRPEHCVRRERI